MQQQRLIISSYIIQDTSQAPGSEGSERQERALVRRQDALERGGWRLSLCGPEPLRTASDKEGMTPGVAPSGRSMPQTGPDKWKEDTELSRGPRST